jgi:hypothetical protein
MMMMMMMIEVCDYYLRVEDQANREVPVSQFETTKSVPAFVLVAVPAKTTVLFKEILCPVQPQVDVECSVAMFRYRMK